jgi:hypothetical protein
MFRARCVPNVYLFGTFSAQNTAEIEARFPPRWREGLAERLATTAPSLQALRRAAKGWVEEYGHLAASDATEGRTVAKKTAFGLAGAGTFWSGFVWEQRPCWQWRDGSVTSLVRAS